MQNHFIELYALDMSDKAEELKKTWTDKRTGEEKSLKLSYLHWTAAVKVLGEKFPDADWDIREWDGKPYLMTEKGAMVYVSVTIGGKKKGCWLPVMNQKHEVIEEPDAFDINTAHWRCFVKACALHGIGLSLYEKDDRPADKEAAKHPPMKPGTHGESVSLDVTVVKAFELRGGAGSKLDCLTDAGESVKVTVFARKKLQVPGQGEHVTVMGIWEVSDQYGAGIVAERIVSGEGTPPPAKTADDGSGIEDTPANRAAALRKYTERTRRAEELGVAFTHPDKIRTKTVDGLIAEGKKLQAAIEKAERDASYTGSQEPANPGSGAAGNPW